MPEENIADLFVDCIHCGKINAAYICRDNPYLPELCPECKWSWENIDSPRNESDWDSPEISDYSSH